MSDGTVSQKSTSPVHQRIRCCGRVRHDLPHDPVHLDDARAGRAVGRFCPWDVVGIVVEHDAVATLALGRDIAKWAGADGIGHRYRRVAFGVHLAHDRRDRCAWASKQELEEAERLLQRECKRRRIDDAHARQPRLELAAGGAAIHPVLQRRRHITGGDFAAIMKPEAWAQAEGVGQPVRADHLIVHHQGLRRQRLIEREQGSAVPGIHDYGGTHLSTGRADRGVFRR
jgi:hypothetical protein